jgi:outer membrane protein assembly factor BamB
VAACFVIVGVAFALVNSWSPAARACEALMGAIGIPWRLWVDPTDLMALAVLPIAWRTLPFRALPFRALPFRALPFRAPDSAMRDADLRNSWRRAGEALGMVTGAIACMATSLARPPAPVVIPGSVLAQAWAKYPLHVIDTATGRVTARLELDGYTSDAKSDEGTLYLLSHRRVRALDTHSGRVAFEHVNEDSNYGPRIEVDGERLYLLTTPSASSSHEHAVAIDAKRGRVVWDVALPSANSWRGYEAMHVLGGGLLLIPIDDAVIAIHPHSGKTAWVYRADGAVHHLAVAGNIAYGATPDGIIHAIDMDRGTLMWRHDARSKSRAFGAGSWTGARRLSAVDGKLMFIQDRRLSAIDGLTRTRRWRTKDTVLDAVVDAHLAVALLEDGETLVAYGVTDGRERWRRVLEQDSAAAPVIASREGVVLVRPWIEKLFAYEIADGNLRWQVDLLDGEHQLEVSKRVVAGGAVF